MGGNKGYEHQMESVISTKGDNPLVTYIVFSFNQQEYILDAIESALAQDYSPLEIIISDDCSTDQTYPIIIDAISKYKGPHRVVARQNQTNLGLINHVNEAKYFASADWLVVAAGDDLSCHNRVSMIMNIAHSSVAINMVSSGLEMINEQGETKGYGCLLGMDNANTNNKIILTGIADIISNTTSPAHGATLAYKKKLLTDFVDMPSDAVYEDAILEFRSALLGLRAHINEPLIKYRHHDRQATNTRTADAFNNNRKMLRLYRGAYVVMKQNLTDFEVSQSIDIADEVSVKKWLTNRLRFYRFRYESIANQWPFRLVPYLFMFMYSFAALESRPLRYHARVLLPDFVFHMVMSKRTLNYSWPD